MISDAFAQLIEHFDEAVSHMAAIDRLIDEIKAQEEAEVDDQKL